MNPLIIGLIGLIFLFALLFLGIPVSVSMALIGFAGIWYMVGFKPAIVSVVTTPIDWITSYDLVVIPLFTIMAEVCTQSGMSRNLYDLAYKWLGGQPGGLAMATMGACGIFAAISSTSFAGATTMGAVALPEMKRYKYDPGLATATVAVGGCLGILIPPSSAFVIYGFMTQTSIGKLLIAGIIPGIISVILYILTIYFLCRFKPNLGPRGPRFSYKEKFKSFGSCGEIIALIILVLGGIMFGWFTPTEAGAVGAVGAILLSLIRRRLNWQKFWNAITESLKITGIIYAMLVGAVILTSFIAMSRIPIELGNFISGLSWPPLAVMIVIILVYTVLGCLMDTLAMILLTIPMFFPVAVSLGYNPIWFGVLIIMMMELALITPPIGLNVFIVAGMNPDVPMATIFKGVVPFVLMSFVVIVILLFFPQIALFLPNLMISK